MSASEDVGLRKGVDCGIPHRLGRKTNRPVSSSNTICNGSNPPLANIVLFGLSLSDSASKFLKRIY